MKKKILFLFGIAVVVSLLLFLKYSSPEVLEKNEIQKYIDQTGKSQEEVIKNLENIEKWSNKIQEDDSNFDYYIELARSYEYLGETNKAVEAYKSYSYEKIGIVLYLYNNNLAKIYDKKGDYKEANKHYLEIIKAFDGQYLGSYKSLIENYIILKDKDNAWKYYVEFQKAGGESMEILKKLEKM